MKTGNLVFGRNPVYELLQTNPERITKIYIQKGVRIDQKIYDRIKEFRIPVSLVSREKLKSMVGNVNHQGIVARISPIETVSASEIIERVVKNRGIVAVIDHVEDPQNLGNIIRTTEVLGGLGVVIPSRRQAPLSETVVKASAGAIFHIPVAVVPNIASFLRNFKKEGGFVVSIEVGGENIFNFKFPFPLAIVIGGEDKGVSRLTLKESDYVVSIPMKGKTGSLNAASAFAIALAFAVKDMG